MDTINTQKTYKGKTAGGYVKSAKVTRMQAGTYEVTTPLLPGAILVMSDDGDMVIRDYDGIVVSLECSGKAASKLDQLTDLANDKMEATI